MTLDLLLPPVVRWGWGSRTDRQTYRQRGGGARGGDRMRRERRGGILLSTIRNGDRSKTKRKNVLKVGCNGRKCDVVGRQV